MKAYGEWSYNSTIHDLGTVGGEWSDSRPVRFTPRERAACTHWIGGWVGPRVGLDAVEENKFLYCRESNPGRPARRYIYSITDQGLRFNY
jgi:hypothetical protein